jgi:hypothetical protein
VIDCRGAGGIRLQKEKLLLLEWPCRQKFDRNLQGINPAKNRKSTEKVNKSIIKSQIKTSPPKTCQQQ